MHERVRSLALAAVLAMTATCGGHAETRHVADRFMALYYDQSHVPDALQLCTGRAKARLEYEVKFMKGAPPPAPENVIHASFQLRGESFPTRTQARYFYRVYLGRPGAQVLFARVSLVKVDGQWLVAEFDEKERASNPGATGPAQ